MNVTSNAERQRRFKEAQEATGKKQVSFFVTSNAIETFKQYAGLLNDKAVAKIAVFTPPKHIKLDNEEREYRLTPVIPKLKNNPEQLKFDFEN
jgi:hypothetical protein